MNRNVVEPPSVELAAQSHPEPSFNWRDFRPEMLPDKSRFAAELTTYRDHLDSLLPHAGKYVVIKGAEIIGIHDDFDAAVEAAFQVAPEFALVKLITEHEPVREVGHVLS